jgi:hypothetical protein
MESRNDTDDINKSEDKMTCRKKPSAAAAAATNEECENLSQLLAEPARPHYNWTRYLSGWCEKDCIVSLQVEVWSDFV